MQSVRAARRGGSFHCPEGGRGRWRLTLAGAFTFGRPTTRFLRWAPTGGCAGLFPLVGMASPGQPLGVRGRFILAGWTREFTRSARMVSSDGVLRPAAWWSVRPLWAVTGPFILALMMGISMRSMTKEERNGHSRPGDT